MLRIRKTSLALLGTLAALALGACGSDDDEKDSGASTADQAKTETTNTSTSSGSPQDNPRGKEITSCLKQAGLNVILNPASQFDGEYQLVINSGGAGVLYGFSDNSAAQAARAKVQKYEGTSQRKTEVIGDTVLAYFPPDQTLAQPEDTAKVRKCAR
jgi:ABC-type glycerol-3-phosphate transport system substrate-binding protein